MEARQHFAGPGVFHPGATLSYKQTLFDVTNVQPTFHQGNAKTLQGPDGSPVDCIVIEPDIVRNIGHGDIDLGHKILDRWIMKTRKDHIKTLKNLAPPAKD